MRVIGVATQKGGVGKTTTARETAALLASDGWRVLAIDMDGQHDLTNFFLDDVRPGATVTDALAGTASPSDAVVRTGREGLDLMPADDRAYSMGDQDVTADAMAGLVAGLAGSYDWAVVDFPRIVSKATIAALTACDAVVVPTEASRASAEAAEATLDTLRAIGGPPASILVTRFNARTTIARRYADLIADMAEGHGARVFRTRISLATAVPEAEGYGLTLSEHKPRSRPAQNYRDYLRELLGTFALS